MKKFLIFATALFAAVSFGACSDNGHENETDLSQLYGTWQQTRTYGYSRMMVRARKTRTSLGHSVF